MKKQLTFTLAALLLASTAPAALAATITGTITGPDGAPFRAAFVRVQNVKTKMTMMVLSDSRGKYWTDRLDPGTYEVSATWVDYKGDRVRRRTLTLEGDTPPTPHFTLNNHLVHSP